MSFFTGYPSTTTQMRHSTSCEAREPHRLEETRASRLNKNRFTTCCTELVSQIHHGAHDLRVSIHKVGALDNDRAHTFEVSDLMPREPVHMIARRVGTTLRSARIRTDTLSSARKVCTTSALDPSDEPSSRQRHIPILPSSLVLFGNLACSSSMSVRCQPTTAPLLASEAQATSQYTVVFLCLSAADPGVQVLVVREGFVWRGKRCNLSSGE